MKEYKTAIIYGLISGILIVCYYLVFYYMNKNLIAKIEFSYSVFALQVPFLIAAGLKYRNRNEGLLEFKEALKIMMITYLISLLFYFIIYYVLFNYDADLVAMSKQYSIDSIEWLKTRGMQKEQYESMMNDAQNSSFEVTIGTLLRGIPFSILGGFFVSSLCALMVRR